MAYIFLFILLFVKTPNFWLSFFFFNVKYLHGEMTAQSLKIKIKRLVVTRSCFLPKIYKFYNLFHFLNLFIFFFFSF